jgi:hypothetical protein
LGSVGYLRVRVLGKRTGISITVSRSDRRRLQATAADRKAPQKHVWRAKIVLFSADIISVVVRSRGHTPDHTDPAFNRLRLRLRIEARERYSRSASAEQPSAGRSGLPERPGKVDTLPEWSTASRCKYCPFSVEE